MTTDQLLFLLRRAGDIMRRMPGAGSMLHLAVLSMGAVDDPRLAYGYTPVELNRVFPTAYELSLMDFVYRWLGMIPDDRYVVRKIVAHRMLWDPDRGRSVWSYRRLADKVGASHVAVKNWDEYGVETIRKAVDREKALTSKIDLYMSEFSGLGNYYLAASGVARAPQSSSANFALQAGA